MDNVEGDRSSQEAELHVAQVTPGSVMRSSAVSRPAVGAGVLAMVVSFVGSWIPLFWYDEMVTLSAARRSPDELLRLVGNVDAVHGLYYALMSGWLRLVPDTTLWVRLPGVLAIGVAGAGVFVLTWMVSTPSTAWIAAVVFAVLPATVQTAVEARPYAFTMAAAVWSTVALVSLIRALLDDRRWWPYAVGYVALIVLAVLFASLSLLILGAHAVTVLLAARTRRVVGVFALCAVTATALVSPLVLEVSRQSGQVDWISRFHYSPVLRMNDVAFPYAPQLTLLVLVVLAWGLVRMVRRRGGGAEDVDMSESATSRPDRLPPSLPAVAGPWLVVPPILLALYSLLVTPAFVTRYLTFSAPAVALLLAAAFAWLGAHRRLFAVPAAAVWTAVFVVLAIPSVVFLHSTFAKPFGSDYRTVSAYLASHVHRDDCVVYGYLEHPEYNSRFVSQGYPQGFDTGRDLLVDRSVPSAVERGQLWEKDVPVDTVGARAAGCPRVWVLTDDADASAPVASLRQSGFREQPPATAKELRVIEFLPPPGEISPGAR